MRRVELEDDFYRRQVCSACGGTWEKYAVKAKLVIPDGGWICEECLKAGPEGMKPRLIAHAERLEARAKDLREAAEEDWQMPTYEDWVRVHEKHVAKSVDDMPF